MIQHDVLLRSDIRVVKGAPSAHVQLGDNSLQ